MKFRTYSLPFVITLIAMPLNWVISYPGIGVFTWTPEVLGLLAFVGLAAAGRINPTFTPLQLGLMCLSVFHVVLQALRGQGFGDSAIISVIVMALLFLVCFRTSRQDSLHKTIIRQITVIYTIHVCFVVLEVILLKTGNAGIMMGLSHNRYKGSAALLHYGQAPQALFLQSQAAAQVCVFASLWFGMLYLSRRALGFRFRLRHAAVLLASLLVFGLYPTTTIMVVGLCLLLAITYLIPFSRRRFLRTAVPILMLASFASAALTFPSPAKAYADAVDKLTHAIPSEVAEDALVYDIVVANPVAVWWQLPWADWLWGVGGMEEVLKRGVESADVAITITMLQAGVVLGLAAIVGVTAMVWQMLAAARQRRFLDSARFPWLWLGCANALISAGFLFSLAHYAIALQSGGRTLFSLHLAVTMLSLRQLGCQHGAPRRLGHAR